MSLLQKSKKRYNLLFKKIASTQHLLYSYSYQKAKQLMSDKNINFTLIINGCRRDNRNSQRILYEQYFGFALNICLRYTGKRLEAEEVLNNGFLKVFRHIDKYNTAYPFKVWLRRIMINAAIDYHRANQRVPLYVALEEAPEKTTEMPLPQLHTNEDVLPILQQLPPMYRLVFNLAVMEGYRHEEISQLLGISVSTSRSNLTRAKQKLKGLLLITRNPKFSKHNG